MEGGMREVKTSRPARAGRVRLSDDAKCGVLTWAGVVRVLSRLFGRHRPFEEHRDDGVHKSYVNVHMVQKGMQNVSRNAVRSLYICDIDPYRSCIDVPDWIEGTSTEGLK